MDAGQLKFILEELQFSADLPNGVLNHLAAASTVQTVPRGTILFRDGAVNHNLYLVRRGRVALEMKVPGRGSARILTLGPGEMCGWSALLTHGKMTAGAVAVEDSELIVAPADKLRLLCESNPDFGYHLMQRMAEALSRRLVATRLQLLDLFADAAPPAQAAHSEGEE